MSPQQKRVRYSVVTAVISVALSCGFAVGFVTYQNQKWCDTLAALTKNDPSKLPPPSTPAGKAQRPQDIYTYKTLVKVRKGFYC